MHHSSFSGFFQTYMTFIIVAMLLALAVIATPIMLVGIPAYVFYRLYTESPRRLERLAREETQTLYRNAVAGNVLVTPEETKTLLSRHWPADTPDTLKGPTF